jgi:hypothetical protein
MSNKSLKDQQHTKSHVNRRNMFFFNLRPFIVSVSQLDLATLLMTTFIVHNKPMSFIEDSFIKSSPKYKGTRDAKDMFHIKHYLSSIEGLN